VFQRTLPEWDPLNFAPHVKQPTLMVNGRYDYSLPAETSKSLYSELWGPRRTKNATSSWKPAMSRPTTW